MNDLFTGEPPKPFNPDARPGLAKAVSAAYAAYCDSPEAPKCKGPSLERAKQYHLLYTKLRTRYPSYRELAEQQQKEF